MRKMFADRMGNVQKSFIREILKVTVNPKVIICRRASQSLIFSCQRSSRSAVPLLDDGADPESLEKVLMNTTLNYFIL